MKKCNRKLLAIVATFIAVAMFFLFIYNGITTLKDICESEINAKINNVINQSNDVVLALDVFYEDFFTLVYDKNNEISAVIANSDLINKITLIWNTEIQNRLNSLRYVNIEMPAGVLTGSALLSQFGANITAKAQVISNCAISYRSEFTQAGINQTRHRLILYTEVLADVTVPITASDVTVFQEIILAESILLGNVPSTYLIENSESSHLDLLP